MGVATSSIKLEDRKPNLRFISTINTHGSQLFQAPFHYELARTMNQKPGLIKHSITGNTMAAIE